MCPLSREFSMILKINEYSDYLEDTEWKSKRPLNIINSTYSDLLEDSEW